MINLTRPLTVGTAGPGAWLLRVFGVMSNHVGTLRAPDVRRLPRPPDAFSSAGRSGAPIVTLFAVILPWGASYVTLLRTKHCDLAAWPSPLSPPWYPGGPRAEGLAIAAWDWSGMTTTKTQNSEKHLWLDSL